MLFDISNSVSAGLPQIYGGFSNAWDTHTYTGAFTTGGQTGNWSKQGNGSHPYCWVYFYASYYNSIYGASDTVTPKSQKANFAIRY